MKEQQTDTRQQLQALYESARKAGKCHTWQEFAELTHTNRSLLSQWNSDKMPSSKTIAAIRYELEKQGIAIFEGDVNVGGGAFQGQGVQINFQSSERETQLLGIVSDLTHEITAQRESYCKQIEQLMSAVTALANRK